MEREARKHKNVEKHGRGTRAIELSIGQIHKTNGHLVPLSLSQWIVYLPYSLSGSYT